MTKMPKAVWIPKVFGQHPSDWDFSLENFSGNSVRYVHNDIVSKMGDEIKRLNKRLKELENEHTK